MTRRVASAARVRARARVQGTVQGVGFRPFVYRVATEERLGGWVLNDERGVLLEVEGGDDAVQGFLDRLRTEAPPLAVIDAVACEHVPATGERGFRILESMRTDSAIAPPVAADSATCPDCLAELTDPGDRRHRYPFINCTNCGPRLTIVTGVPYDRPLTTMAEFVMCPACAHEYADPADRRFHAQPNACPACGPRVRVAAAGGAAVDAFGDAVDAVDWIAQRLAAGAIVAVKSIGGFHLVCDGADEDAVSALRGRKHREDKPFALLAGSVAGARRLVALTGADEALLTGPARPIVLAPRRDGRDRVRIASAVAPGLPELGVMLPYAPLHHLLIADFARAAGDGDRPLVMTSGNVSDDPIAFEDEDALERLAGIADLFLLHDRRIETRTDDSVLRTVALPASPEPSSFFPPPGKNDDGTAGRGDDVAELPAPAPAAAAAASASTTSPASPVSPAPRTPLMLRRSRGYVPAPLTLPIAAPRPLLACGAEQKSTFCVATGARAWVSHHIGDLEHHATLEAFDRGVAHFEQLFSIAPQVIAHDLHPGYFSTQYALERDAAEHVAVQHHHAHLAACLAEHGLTEPVVGAIYDGTGLGTDGTVWGGELLCGGLAACTRDGWLWPVRMPGGAAAVRQPWRMAAAWLREAFGEARPLPAGLRGAVDPGRWDAMRAVGDAAEVSPVTSSMGRLLDAVGALCGLGAEITYEGQAAIALEAAAWQAGAPGAGARARGDRTYEIALAGDGDGDPLVLDPRAMIRELAVELERGDDVGPIAAGVHEAVSAVTAAAVTRIAARRDLATAVLSGGVFQNRWLIESVAARLTGAGLRVLVPERLPPNDGGISFGQAAIAAARPGAGA